MLGTLYFGIIEYESFTVFRRKIRITKNQELVEPQHQMHALDLAGIPYTIDILGDYDVVHIMPYGPRVFCSMQQSVVERKSSCMDIQPVGGFENSFIGSNFLLPCLGKYLAHMYQKADFVITPSEYSKHLIQSYGSILTPIVAVSNGIDLENTRRIRKRRGLSASILISKKAKGCHLCGSLSLNAKGLKTS